MPWWKRKKKIVPQFTVTVLLIDEPITYIDVIEDATLTHARKEIEVAASDFPQLNIEYLFADGNTNVRYRTSDEGNKKIRTVTGTESKLRIIPKHQQIIAGETQQKKVLLKVNEERDAEEVASLDYFISHAQKDGATLAEKICSSMKYENDKTCWLDVNMEERDAAAMEKGVQDYNIFLAIVSELYFTRPFCIKELEWAILKYNKPIIVVIDVDLKNDIGRLLEKCPEHLRDHIGKIDFIDLNRGDIEYWNVGMKKVLQRSEKILQRSEKVMEERKDDKKNGEHTSTYANGTKASDTIYKLKELLDPLNFEFEIADAVERFHTGTRKWAFEDFDKWVENSLHSRVFILCTDAGMGKTGIMSMLVKEKKESVIAHHFCRHDDSRKRNPKRLICSIAYQIAERVPEYRDNLSNLTRKLTSNQLADLNITALFDAILIQPMSGIDHSPFATRQVILIDALDECDRNGKNDLLQCIRDHFLKLPAWLGFFLSTRPEHKIISMLKKFQPRPLEAGAERNMKDIETFLKDKIIESYIRNKLEPRIAPENLDEGVTILCKKSNGVFMYARYAVEQLDPQKQIEIKDLHDFPDGITGFYDQNFRRLLGPNYEQIIEESPEWRIIEIIIVAQEPLHIETLEHLVGCTNKKSKSAVAHLSMLFPVRHKRLHVFHRTVKDWLIDENRFEEHCFVDKKKVHRFLGQRCYDLLLNSFEESDENINDERDEALLYALKHCVTHLCEGMSRKSLKKAKELMFNFYYLLRRIQYCPIHMAVQDCNSIVKAANQNNSIRSPGITSSSPTNIQPLERRPSSVNPKEILDRAFSLLHSALRLSQPGLMVNPYQLAGQLVGRLKGYASHNEEIKTLLDNVKNWKGRDNGQGWWCPAGETLTFEPAGGACVLNLEHAAEVFCCAISFDGKRIVSGGENGMIRLWDVSTGELLTRKNVTIEKEKNIENIKGDVNSIAFSPDGKKILFGLDDYTVRIWSPEKDECRTLKGHTNSVNSVAFNHTGTKIASGSSDYTVRVWEESTDKCLLLLGEHEDHTDHTDVIKVAEGHTDFVQSVAFNHDSTKLVTGADDSTVRLWKIPTGECIFQGKIHTDSVTSVSFNHDSSKIVSGSMDTRILIWNLNGEIECELTAEDNPIQSKLHSIAFNHDGTKIVSGSGAESDAKVHIWNVKNKQCEITFDKHSAPIKLVTFSPNGTKVVSASEDKTVKVCDVETDECQSMDSGHPDSIFDVVFNNDFTKVISRSLDKICIWDVKAGRRDMEYKGLNNNCITLMINHNGTELAAGWQDRNTIDIYDLTNKNYSESLKLKFVLKTDTDSVSALVYNYDSTIIVSGSDDATVQLFDLEMRECILKLKNETSLGCICSVAFNHDFKKIVTGSEDQTISIWNLSSGKRVKQFTGDAGKIISVAFNFDSTKIVAGSKYTRTMQNETIDPPVSESKDPILCIWDVERGTVEKNIKLDDKLKGQFTKPFAEHFNFNDEESTILGLSEGVYANPTVYVNVNQQGYPTTCVAYEQNGSNIHFLKHIGNKPKRIKSKSLETNTIGANETNNCQAQDIYNISSNNYKTDLYIACERNKLDDVLHNKPYDDINEGTKKCGKTPLYIACVHENSINIVKELLQCEKIDVNKTRTDFEYGPLHIACKMNRIDIVKELLKKDTIHVNSIIPSSGETPLLIACLKQYSDIVKELLQCYTEKKIDVKLEIRYKEDGQRILNFAIGYGHLQLIKSLLENDNIDVNKKSSAGPRGMTPLFAACDKQNAEIVKLLLRKEAIDVNKVSLEGITPLYAACFDSQMDIIKLLLAHKSIDVNKATDNKETPLMVACEKGNIDVVKALLETGNMNTSHRKTANDIAVAKGHTDIVDYISNF